MRAPDAPYVGQGAARRHGQDQGSEHLASGVEEILYGVDHVGEKFRLVVDRIDEHDRVTLQIEVMPTGERDAIAREVSKRMHTALGITLEIEPLPPGTLPKTELKARRWLDR